MSSFSLVVVFEVIRLSFFYLKDRMNLIDRFFSSLLLRLTSKVTTQLTKLLTKSFNMRMKESKCLP
ncbi:hypothetical protein P4159_03470 [Bacillus thuringiensis]|nr:hypothetical protein [Bacillus thuringiensis]MED2712157.1 hypothetical protein [Bacillus thuringiensis]